MSGDLKLPLYTTFSRFFFPAPGRVHTYGVFFAHILVAAVGRDHMCVQFYEVWWFHSYPTIVPPQPHPQGCFGVQLVGGLKPWWLRGKGAKIQKLAGGNPI